MFLTGVISPAMKYLYCNVYHKENIQKHGKSAWNVLEINMLGLNSHFVKIIMLAIFQLFETL